jgi:kumamolisin
LPDQEYWVKTPVGKRKFLSRAEFAARYGAAQTDLDRVAEFARSHQLSIREMSVSRRLVIVSGTVAQVSRAFSVELGRYESPTETYRGREGYIYVPNEIADIVEGVFGLDNRKMAQRASNGGPPGAVPLTPPQVAGLYNFPPGKQPGGAAGQTIGILEFGGGFDIKDINAFCKGLGLPKPSVQPVSVDSVTTTLSGLSDASSADPEEIEVALDVEVAASVAVGANIAVYFVADKSDQSWIGILTQAISGEGLPQGWAPPSVLSCSWGWPELLSPSEAPGIPFEWTQQAITLVTESFSEAAMKGITVFVSCGDMGSDAGVGDGAAHVQYPSSDPWVTACGGTEITGISPLQEETWNDAMYPPYTGATGGGISDFFSVPSWQAGIVPNSVNPPGTRQGRGVPDVAGNASSYSGYVLSIYGKQTTEVYVNGTLVGPSGAYGGTSAVAPLYAALVALINAQLGFSVGYLNPTLYTIGQIPGQTVIRDINDGLSNGFNGVRGYTSAKGWDACTGWGVVNGSALLEEIVAVAVSQNPGCVAALQAFAKAVLKALGM